MAHEGGINCYGGEKAMITKGSFPDPQKRTDFTFSWQESENAYRGDLMNLFLKVK